jgi:hypothetical protein
MRRLTNPVCPPARTATRGPVGEVAALILMMAPLAALILFQGH